MGAFLGLPSTPSDYAALAAQSVLGQVLEGVQPLPDETRIPALAEAMTAFMEAWMEHILKQKIKFRLVWNVFVWMTVYLSSLTRLYCIENEWTLHLEEHSVP